MTTAAMATFVFRRDGPGAAQLDVRARRRAQTPATAPARAQANQSCLAGVSTSRSAG